MEEEVSKSIEILRKILPSVFDTEFADIVQKIVLQLEGNVKELELNSP
jgi:hypothetical protein